ncbi:hypothetical protein SUGI_0795790 [Cryptomeria japonica]|nr:hypothetical protein SUGI_0795790 [Cryptomeria japonica]
MIAGYAQNGFCKDALKLFELMKHSGTNPDHKGRSRFYPQFLKGNLEEGVEDGKKQNKRNSWKETKRCLSNRLRDGLQSTRRLEMMVCHLGSNCLFQIMHSDLYMFMWILFHYGWRFLMLVQMPLFQ